MECRIIFFKCRDHTAIFTPEIKKLEISLLAVAFFLTM